jgi:hypothetical protein
MHSSQEPKERESSQLPRIMAIRAGSSGVNAGFVEPTMARKIAPITAAAFNEAVG